MSKGPAPVKGDVTIAFEGRVITASYSVAAGMVTIHTPNGSKTIRLGNAQAYSLARIYLRELAEREKCNLTATYVADSRRAHGGRMYVARSAG